MPHASFAVEPEHSEEFGAWLRPVELRVFFEPSGRDRWYATLEEYSISGVGPTKESAAMDALSQLGPYLYSEFADGKSWDQARRPISRRLQLEFRSKVVASEIRRRLSGGRTIASSASEQARTLQPGELCY